jgi:hypothetical protein
LYSEHALHSLQVADDYYVSKDINRAVWWHSMLFFTSSFH